ncbi:hypothetical protein QBZ16_001768 [Prototheca wickerhamii]|uniref:V-SNARE coiled-coil homology domain-containing protein n=1 Tax=Prototheca wickerhamii TaxID=3111 RepID=A0AAD9MIU9_PROWI|nr:hypothetical protein QBZ16_001768 [Prototheca wickerhamii]
MGLFAWTRQPEPPASLYDWDTAAATAAASTPTAVPAERASSTDSATSAAMLPLKLFEGVRDTATGFVEGAVKLPILKVILVLSPLPPASHTSAARPLAGSAAAAQAPGPLGVVDASGSKPVNRTASQIRKAYGRAPSARDSAASTQAILSDNMRRLGERGEKLSRLEERTAELEEGAMDFASASKQLADSFANRKWWQM